MISYSLPPSSGVLNQAAAMMAWAALAIALCATLRKRDVWSTAAVPTLLALAVLSIGIIGSAAWNQLPQPLALMSIGAVLATAALFMVGLACREAGYAESLISMLAAGLVTLGSMLALVCVIQVLAPQWADGDWIARTSLPGRAIGNMRQPNHVAVLLCWSFVSALWLGATQRLSKPLVMALLVTFGFAIVLTASRTGLVGLLLLSVWGGVDKKLPVFIRRALVFTPVLLAGAWFLAGALTQGGDQAVGAAQRMTEGGGSPARMAIWSDAIELIRRYPLLGVGWGEFNLAWTLSPFTRRSPVAFDHTHNLPLQLIVELGLPMGLGVLLLLIWGMRLLARSLRAAQGAEAVALRCAAMMLALVGLHSLLEFPLWYMYFLLPTALLWGLCSGRPTSPRPAPAEAQILPCSTLQLSCALVLTAGLVMLLDYSRVTVLYDELPAADMQFERAQQAWLFGTAADYAYATHFPASAQTLPAARRAAHLVVDARLLIAWAEALEAAGDIDRARYLVARLREFQAPEAKEWLRRCEAPKDSEKGAIGLCDGSSKTFTYRDFL
ncbi:Wzy polymerase domain-containing protein [Paucibacter sediminis]|uniref:Wzy polymerase domain-containing protein n=1 Tax=Paucibacter sediminis TaxID=3019553 RepID=A0AA95SMC2_9BURK|nr:O-antigen ligase family protein [Paucibacter sp. S2-9]WIT13133.1 Wzy polymerase domain-containing protein [Paucibacter sp. S2-9]